MNIWDSLGYAHHHLGRHQQAITCCHSALDHFHVDGDRFYEADTLSRLGDTQQAAGIPDSARDSWLEALKILDDLGHTNADQVRTKLARLDPHDSSTE